MTPYYADDLVTIYHGDALAILANIADIAATVTSPPYNTLGSRIPSKPSGLWARRMAGFALNVRETGYGDDMDETAYAAWLRDIAAAIAVSTRPGGALFFNHKLRHRDGVLSHPLNLVQSFEGWSVRQELIWQRPGSMQFNARMFAPNDERIYWLVRDGGDFVWNQDAAKLMTIWPMQPPVEIAGHPCPFPVTLAARCIAAVTHEDDVALDPFMGSGTTLVAAKSLNRHAIGIEIDGAVLRDRRHPLLAGRPWIGELTDDRSRHTQSPQRRVTS